jgi:hypothetical protein
VGYTGTNGECGLCLKIADSINDQKIGYFEKLVSRVILVREALTYYYTKIYLRKNTLKELKLKIMKLFKNKTSKWKSLRKGNEEKRIFRIVKSGLNYYNLFWGDSLNSDEKVRNLKSGDQLEVIFI